MKKLFRKNHWSTEDKLLLGAGVVAAIGVFAIVQQRKSAATAATVAGLRGLRGMGEYFREPMGALGLGAYFIDPVYKPIKGLGTYVQVR